MSLRAACFADGVYDPAAAETCVSNLLDARFEKFILDLYWDSGLRQWSLCPVQLPGSNYPTTSSLQTTVATAKALSSAGLTPSVSSLDAKRQQTHASNATLTSPSTSIGSQNLTVTSTSSTPSATFTNVNGEPLYKVGNYECSSSLNLAWISSLFVDYFGQTPDTVSANFVFWEIDLHAAASSTNPLGPASAPKGGELPGPEELVSNIILSPFDSYIYTPAILETDRININSSWFDVPEGKQPLLGYFTITTLSNGDLATPDGWPSMSYMLLTKARRILLSWGTKDPQMENYTTAADAGTIFSRSDASKPVSVTSNSIGELTSGCFYHSDETTMTSQTNSSWAVNPQLQAGPNLTNNLTTCGISPILNSTLSSSPATSPSPYVSFVHSTVWSWAASEPRNTSNLTTSSSPGLNAQFRCALLDPASAGHWRVDNCLNKFPVACRHANTPYNWTVSPHSYAFATAPAGCPEDTFFDVPRTGLENKYLLHALRAAHPSSPPDGLWLNLNSLSVANCWVPPGHANASCPYAGNPDQQSRDILVPTIAAMIVLILTALTIFVKCNVNRRRGRVVKRHKRLGPGGGWYDGIPA